MSKGKDKSKETRGLFSSEAGIFEAPTHSIRFHKPEVNIQRRRRDCIRQRNVVVLSDARPCRDNSPPKDYLWRKKNRSNSREIKK